MEFSFEIVNKNMSIYEYIIIKNLISANIIESFYLHKKALCCYLQKIYSTIKKKSKIKIKNLEIWGKHLLL